MPIRALFAVVVLSLAGLAAASTISPAEAASNATCSFSVHVVISPGVSTVQTLETIQGDSGGINCPGGSTIFGKQVAGSGPLSVSGTSLDTCASAEGSASVRGSVPKVNGGNLRVQGTIRFERTGTMGTFTGTLEASNGETAAVTGTFSFSADSGQTCPPLITGATASGTVRVFGS